MPFIDVFSVGISWLLKMTRFTVWEPLIYYIPSTSNNIFIYKMIKTRITFVASRFFIMLRRYPLKFAGVHSGQKNIGKIIYNRREGR